MEDESERQLYEEKKEKNRKLRELKKKRRTF